MSNAAIADKPLVSLVLPCYNEAAVLSDNLALIMQYLRSLEARYRFEILLINDGSKDDTGEIVDALQGAHPIVRAFHHPTNFGLGQAFKTAFAQSRGDYVVTMDVDLSYSPDHIGLLLDKLLETRAKLVLASPYMPGGRLTNIPTLRKMLSIWGNRFLRVFARGNLSTLTCMVRGYDGPFIRSLILRAQGMDIMPEVVYKSMVLRARIEQVPAHLDWTRQLAVGVRRASSMRVLRHIFSTVLSGFIFRPFMFLVLPGAALLAFALYTNVWMLLHFFDALVTLPPDQQGSKASAAVALAYQRYPHTFIVGLASLMLSLQLIGLGAIALQAKKYFEELYYVGISINRRIDPEARKAFFGTGEGRGMRT